MYNTCYIISTYKPFNIRTKKLVITFMKKLYKQIDNKQIRNQCLKKGLNYESTVKHKRSYRPMSSQFFSLLGHSKMFSRVFPMLIWFFIINGNGFNENACALGSVDREMEWCKQLHSAP